MRVQSSSKALNADLVATPFFRPDALPSPRRFLLYNPFPGAAAQEEVTPAARAGNTKVALRLYRSVAAFDVSLYGYRGFWRTPGIRRSLRFYPRLAVAVAVFFSP